MNITVSSIYNEIIADIQSRLRTSVKFTPRSSSVNRQENTVAAEEEVQPSFSDVLEEYVNKNITDDDIDAVIQDSISVAAAKYNVDENLIKAVIKQESNYDPFAVSKAGAVGLMQLMPSTALSLGVTDSYNIVQNIFGGTDYLSQMLDKFGGDESLALAAYNAGPGSVQKYGGIPPYNETMTYVPKVLDYKKQYLLQEYAKAASLK